MDVDLKCLKTAPGRKASVLILVLIVISSMVILSVGLTYRTRIELKLAWTNARRTQAYYLALGGIERIKALLSQQESSPPNIAAICRFNRTAREEMLFEQLKDCDTDEGKFLAYGLRDELGYLNINKSDPASWENTGIISKEFRAGILDWIDTDDDTNPAGAETDFYERLDPPYVSKNGPCVALKELLFIRAITRHRYLGKGLSQKPPLDGNDKQAHLQSPFDNGDDKFNSGLVNIFTVYGDGKININTASVMILAALPGLDEEVAETILTYRAGYDGRLGTDDDMYLASTEDLVNLEGLTELQIELLGQYCCFDSEYFRILSYAGLDNGVVCCLMATIKYTENQPQVICLDRLM